MHLLYLLAQGGPHRSDRGLTGQGGLLSGVKNQTQLLALLLGQGEVGRLEGFPPVKRSAHEKAPGSQLPLFSLWTMAVDHGRADPDNIGSSQMRHPGTSSHLDPMPDGLRRGCPERPASLTL